MAVSRASVGRCVPRRNCRSVSIAKKRSTWLIQGSRGRREVDVPARALGEPVADEFGLVSSGVVDDDMNVEVGRNVGLDGVEELAELARDGAGSTGR
jgi:hypothetical protein